MEGRKKGEKESEDRRKGVGDMVCCEGGRGGRKQCEKLLVNEEV